MPGRYRSQLSSSFCVDVGEADTDEAALCALDDEDVATDLVT